ESSTRLATIVACGRGSPVVEREDIEWALKLGEFSFDAACSNYPKYMKTYYEFPTFCRKIHEAVVAAGRMPDWEVQRIFGRNQKWGTEVKRALEQLQNEKHIKRGQWRTGDRGPYAEGWVAIIDE